MWQWINNMQSATGFQDAGALLKCLDLLTCRNMVKREDEAHQVGCGVFKWQVFGPANAEFNTGRGISCACCHLVFVNLYGCDMGRRQGQLPRECTIARTDVHSSHAIEVKQASEYIKMGHAGLQSAAAIAGQGMMAMA